VRAEEKELEGPDLEREQRVETSRREAHEEEELPEVVGEEMQDISFDHRSRLFEALRLVLAGEQINLTLLYLPQRETRALEALQTAVTGSDSIGEFVFAEDRRALLEQALAVLQQNLTYGEPSQLAELQSKFDAMTEQVGELREHLLDLEDAQEADEFHHVAREKRGDADGDKDDKPDDKPTPDAGLAAFVSTLTDGPEIEQAPKPRSSLYDDDDAPAASPTATHDPAPQRRVAKQAPDEPEQES